MKKKSAYIILGMFIVLVVFIAILVKIAEPPEYKSVSTPMRSDAETGDLVIVEGDFLIALQDPSILSEMSLFPRKKGQAIECFQIAHINPNSELLKLKFLPNDCLISMAAFSPIDQTPEASLLRVDIELNTPSNLTKIPPALKNAVRVNLLLERAGKQIFYIYMLKRI